MNETLLGVIIGGCISIIPVIFQICFSLILHNKQKIERREELFRQEKIAAYKVLLNFINSNIRNMEPKEFDFYYADVMPYASDELEFLINEYYKLFFEKELYKKSNGIKSEKEIEMRRGFILNKINEQIKKEFQEIIK